MWRGVRQDSLRLVCGCVQLPLDIFGIPLGVVQYCGRLIGIVSWGLLDDRLGGLETHHRGADLILASTLSL